MYAEEWTKFGKASQNRDKQEWAEEKPKLDTAHFSDTDDTECSEIFKKQEEHWKDRWLQSWLASETNSILAP